ncbi:MAG: hypothetical protein ACLFRG_12880 [Desulfococcaceae bacterium]
MEPGYQISTDQNDIIIRLSKKNIPRETLLKLLDFLEMDAIRTRSQLTEEDAAAVSIEIKKNAWRQVKHLFEEAQ